MLLYKYRDGKCVDMFKTWELIFSQPSIFADPFECRPITTTEDDEAVHVKKTVQWYQPLLLEALRSAGPLGGPESAEAIKERFLDEHFGDKKTLPVMMLRNIADESIANADETHIAVFCLSSTRSSPLMWSQYADAHRGFVAGFDATDDYFQAQEHGFGQPMKIQYSTERPTWSWAALTRYNRFLTKSVDFMYEKEWRVLRNITDSLGPVAMGTNDEASGIFGPQQPRRHRYRFEPSAVKEIILGARMPYDHQKGLVDIIRSDSRLAHVKILCAQCDAREYKMNILPAPPHLMQVLGGDTNGA